MDSLLVHDLKAAVKTIIGSCQSAGILIDGKDAVLGRLASYAAKEALKGEEVTVLNCEKILVTGNENNFRAGIVAKRGRVGTTQKGQFRRHPR